MKGVRRYIGVLWLAGAFFQISSAAPVDLRPPKALLGHANERGYLQYVASLGEVRFSDGSGIPLRLDFSSQHADEVSQSGWEGWFCGALESKVGYYGGEQFLRFTLLCGKQLYLERDEKLASLYKSANGIWKATLAGKVILLERSDGWRLRFEDGKVAQLRTDDGKEMFWVRQDGKLRAIAEKGAEQPPLRIDWKDDRPEKIHANGMEYVFAYEDSGNLASIEWDRGHERFSQLKLTREGNALMVKRDSGREWTFEWDPESKQLLSDGWNTYKTVQDSEKLPPLLVLTNPLGKTRARAEDNERGITRIGYGDKGEMRVYRVTRKGPSYQAIGRVDYVVGEEKFTLLRNHFDLRGRVIRREWLGSPFQLSGYANGRYDSAFDPQRTFEPRPPAAGADHFKEAKLVEITFNYSGFGLLREARLGEDKIVEIERDRRGRIIRRWVSGRFEETFQYGENGEETRAVAILPARVKTSAAAETVANTPPSVKKAPPDLLAREEKDKNGNITKRVYGDGRRMEYAYDDNGRLLSEKAWARDGVSGIFERILTYDDANARASEEYTDLLTMQVRHYSMLIENDGSLTGRHLSRGEVDSEQ